MLHVCRCFTRPRSPIHQALPGRWRLYHGYGHWAGLKTLQAWQDWYRINRLWIMNLWNFLGLTHGPETVIFWGKLWKTKIRLSWEIEVVDWISRCAVLSISLCGSISVLKHSETRKHYFVFCAMVFSTPIDCILIHFAESRGVFPLSNMTYEKSVAASHPGL